MMKKKMMTGIVLSMILALTNPVSAQHLYTETRDEQPDCYGMEDFLGNYESDYLSGIKIAEDRNGNFTCSTYQIFGNDGIHAAGGKHNWSISNIVYFDIDENVLTLKRDFCGEIIEEEMMLLDMNTLKVVSVNQTGTYVQVYYRTEPKTYGNNQQINHLEVSGGSEYIIEGSDSRYLTGRDLQGMSKEQLRLARNEIYARRGRIFTSSDLNAYFNSRSWYHGTISGDQFDEEEEYRLNQYETANVALISAYEER